MKKLALLILTIALAVPKADANPYLIYLAATYAAELAATIGPPIAAVTGYGLCYLPSIHVFGNENTTVGLDWASFSNRSRNVYGLQMSFCGGGFAGDLYGLEFGLTACGWVERYDLSKSRMNGLEFAPFAVNAATVNGFQVSACYANAKVVNGFQTGCCFSRAEKMRGLQLGIVNAAKRAHGLQVGLYNYAEKGCFVQLGLVNQVYRRKVPILPVFNAGFR